MTAIENATPIADLTGELQDLWAEYLPLTLRRIGVIRAGSAADGGDAPALEAVRIAAHALVGALGLYGLRDAAAIARTVEHHVGAGRCDPELLASAADELESLVSRPLTLGPT